MRFFFNPLSGQLNAGPPREIVYADTAPQYPLEGSRWFDTINLREYVYTGTEWVESGVGPAGAKGDTGEKGDTGDVGAVGPIGPQGAAATVSVGTVTTVAAGTSASVSNSGTSEAAVFDFTIPQGVKGDTGDTGPQGIQGVKGDDGKSISLKGAVATPTDLNSIAVKTEGDLYVVQSDGDGYIWDGSAWVNVGQIRGPQGEKGDTGDVGATGAQGPAGPAPSGTGAVVVSNGILQTPIAVATTNTASTIVQRDASGNFSAGTITGTFSGNITGDVTGTTSGNAGSATKLATARTVNVSGDVTGTAQSFDGSADITIPTAITAGSIVNADINSAAAIVDTKLATIATAGKVSNSATTATTASTPNTIVLRDENGLISGASGSGGITPGVIDNAVLRANGTAGTTLQNSDIIIDDATTETQANVAITNQHVGQTNSALVLTPKGAGAFILGPRPDGALSGGQRGQYAVDLQLVPRGANTQVASGLYSVISGGQWNRANGIQSVVAGGNGNVASATSSVVSGGSSNDSTAQYSVVSGGSVNFSNGVHSVVSGGQGNTSSGAHSVVSGGHGNTSSGAHSVIPGGLHAVADRYGMLTHSNGQFSDRGDCQFVRFILRNKTTNNTATELFLDGSSTRLTIPSGKIMTFQVRITGVKFDGTDVVATTSFYAISGTGASSVPSGWIKNSLATTTSQIVNSTYIRPSDEVGYVISADDVNDSLKISVTGKTGQTWRWAAIVEGIELAYGT